MLLHLLEVGILNVVSTIGLSAIVRLSTTLEACVARIEACTWLTCATCGIHLLRGCLHGFVETIDGCVNLGYITAVLGLLEGFDGRVDGWFV